MVPSVVSSLNSNLLPLPAHPGFPFLVPSTLPVVFHYGKALLPKLLSASCG